MVSPKMRWGAHIMQKPADLQAETANSCASRLRSERERTGLTQAQAASACDAGQRTYSDWERGISQIPSNRLALLATRGFDCQYILTAQRSRVATIALHLRCTTNSSTA